MHLYRFSVEPLPDHPNFYEVQAGWAHVIFRDDLEQGEMIARAYLERHKWKIHKLQDARLIPLEQFSMMPQEAQEALRVRPIYVEIVGYETGGGPEHAPQISSLSEDQQ